MSAVLLGRLRAAGSHATPTPPKARIALRRGFSTCPQCLARLESSSASGPDQVPVRLVEEEVSPQGLPGDVAVAVDKARASRSRAHETLRREALRQPAISSNEERLFSTRATVARPDGDSSTHRPHQPKTDTVNNRFGKVRKPVKGTDHTVRRVRQSRHREAKREPASSRTKIEDNKARPRRPLTKATLGAGQTRHARLPQTLLVERTAELQLPPSPALAGDPIAQRKEWKRRVRQWAYYRSICLQEADHQKELDSFKQWLVRFGACSAADATSTCPGPEEGKWIYDCMRASDMRRAWEEVEEGTRAEKWPSMMLSTLRHAPEKAVLVLDATLHPLPPSYAIVDVLHFVALRLRRHGSGPPRMHGARVDEVSSLISKVLDPALGGYDGYVRLPQSTLGLLARGLPPDHAKELLNLVKRPGLPWRRNTALHFAARLAAAPAHKAAALILLKELMAEDPDVSETPQFTSVVTTLLHQRIEADPPANGEARFSFRDALQSLMEGGLNPNIINLTALCDTLCRRGKFDEALELARLFVEAGVKPDRRACSTLLRAAKATLGTDRMAKVLDLVNLDGVDPLTYINHMLHSIIYFAEIEARNDRPGYFGSRPVFMPLLRLYAEKLDLAPLQRWIPDNLEQLLAEPHDDAVARLGGAQDGTWKFCHTIVPLTKEFVLREDVRATVSDTTSLVIMLRAYIRSLARSDDIIAFYRLFKSRLEENRDDDDDVSRLVREQGSFIHDCFIQTMMQRRGLRGALEVFADMLRGRLGDASPEIGAKAAENAWTVHPAPSPYTFSILFIGLQSQPRTEALSEQIRQVMREHGVAPTLPVLNTLLRGYASQQSIRKVVNALQQIDKEGFTPNALTYKAFGMLSENAQEGAIRMMEDIVSFNTQYLMNMDGAELNELV